MGASSQAPASAGATSAGGQPQGGATEPLSPPRHRRSSAWVWPALAVTVVALAGRFFGVWGALIVAGQTVATLLFAAADDSLNRSRRSWLTLTAVGAGMIVIAVLFWQASSSGILPKLGAGRAKVPSSGPVNLAGRRLTQSMLNAADLRGATLSGADFNGLLLTRLSLAGAVAPGASFVRSDLQGISLRGADLRGADFSMACLRGSDLSGAQLRGVDIAGADITDAGLSRRVRRTMTGRPAPAGTHVRSCR